MADDKNVKLAFEEVPVKGEPRWKPLSDIVARKVPWLWKGRIAIGELCILEGDPDKGKSTLSFALAAIVSRGRDWPDGSPCPQGSVLIVSAEDSPEYTIKPKLMAAEADQAYISVLNDTALFLPNDLGIIERQAIEVGAKLIIIDPLNAFLSGDIDNHRDQHIRLALNPIAALARRLGIAVIIVRHLNKSGGNNVLYRGGGSIGLIGAARSAFLIAPDPTNAKTHIFANNKNNLARKADSLAFELAPTIVNIQGEAVEVTKVVFQSEPSKLTAKDLLVNDNAKEQVSSIDTASAFLLKELNDGPVNSKQVRRDAKDQGISDMTLRRAISDLEVVSERVPNQGGKRGEGKWRMRLPKVQEVQVRGDQDAQGANSKAAELLDPTLSSAKITRSLPNSDIEHALKEPHIYTTTIQDAQVPIERVEQVKHLPLRVQDVQSPGVQDCELSPRALTDEQLQAEALKNSDRIYRVLARSFTPDSLRALSSLALQSPYLERALAHPSISNIQRMHILQQAAFAAVQLDHGEHRNGYRQ